MKRLGNSEEKDSMGLLIELTHYKCLYFNKYSTFSSEYEVSQNR